MSTVKIFLLGPPSILHEDVPITVDTRKAIALLAYLVTKRQRQSRDTLAGLLWPEYDQDHARATLRRTLSTLNKALASDLLEADREFIGLAAGSRPWVDLGAFASLLDSCRTHGHPAAGICPACLEPLEAAAALYRGDFLAGFRVRDSAAFEEWQFFQAQSLRRDFAGALERLVRVHIATGAYDAAIPHARRWLALDRLHEPAHRELMRLYSWTGQRAAALHQYRECMQVLDQELGVGPLEETTRLYEAIKANQPPAPPARWQDDTATNAHPPSSSASQPPPPAIDAAAATTPTRDAPHARDAAPAPPPSPARTPHAGYSYPLIGRAAEWARLTEAYAASAASGQVVAVEGEAGIGKTRLIDEFLAEPRAELAPVVAVRCYQGENDLAFAPIVAALRAAVSLSQARARLDTIPAHWLAEATRLLPELASQRPDLPMLPPLDSPGAQVRFFEGLRQVTLALCSGPRPALLFLDDVQWADGASLDFLIYLVRRLDERPFCLILAWRSEAVGSGHRLRHLLAEVERSGRLTEVTLSRLDLEHVSALVAATDALGPQVARSVVERVYRETEGIPFFLVEYLAALTKGTLRAEAGDWAPPSGVRDLLHSRLTTLDETGWQLLTTAAVLGRSFDFDTLREVSGRSEEETVAGLEELIVQGLVVEVRASAEKHALVYDFSHEKLQALVYEETSLARRRLMHRRAAEVLIGLGHGSPEAGASAGQIAHHYLNAGNAEAAAEYFKRAGERARALSAHREALRHLEMALSLGHPDAAALYGACGDIYTFTGEYAAALRSYEIAAARAAPERLPTLEHKLGTVYARRGSWALAESHLEAALLAFREVDQSAELARVYADLSLVVWRTGHSERAQELAHQALALADAAGDGRALAQAHNILGVLAHSQADLPAAISHLERSLAFAEQVGDIGANAAALNNLALVCAASGETSRALALAEQALAICIHQGDRHHEAALHNNLADLFHAAGQPEAAMAHLKQAVSIYAEIGVEAGAVQPEIWKLSEW